MVSDEEESSRVHGGSLPVENVQELASKNMKDIPLRYIRPELELDHFSVDESLEIPVIDMSKLGAADHSGDGCESDELHRACKDWGFFQLVNHGISEAVEEMKKVTEEFFKLPLEEKLVYAQLPNSIQGYGQAFVLSDDQKLDWGDMLFLLPLPLARRDMRFWPTIPVAFRSTLDEYSRELKGVALRLLSLMAKNLGIEDDALTRIFDDCVQGIRMNYYPPASEHASKIMGITPHSDATGLTLLVQLNQVQGLQINRNGRWIPINPLPGAIVVNIGDVLEILSNGEYKSIEHRAMVNPEKERLSVAGFHGPNIRVPIGPLPEFYQQEHQSTKYKTIGHDDYFRLVVTSKLDGKSLLEQMRITP